jgi:hypothetical protein
MSPYRENDLVLINHAPISREGYRLPGFRRSLAMVLDTKPKITYIVYVAGKGSEVKFDPFWIDNDFLIPYGDSHESVRHHRGHESPTG